MRQVRAVKQGRQGWGAVGGHIAALAAVVACVWVGCGAGQDEGAGGRCVASAEALERALDRAPQDVVLCAGSRIEGSFRVPAGARLRGEPGAVLIARAGPALRITGSSTERARVVQGLRVVVPADPDTTPVGILVQGAGDVLLQDLTWELGGGVALLALETSGVELVNAEIVGQLPHAAPRSAQLTAGQVPASGVLVSGGGACASVSLRGVHVRGIYGVAVALQGVCGTLEDVWIHDVVGTAVMAADATIDGRDVVVSSVRGADVVSSAALGFGWVVTEGSDLGLRGAGAVDAGDVALFVQGATLRAEGLAIFASRGRAVVVDGQGAAGDTSAQVEGLLLRGAVDAGVMLRGASLELRDAFVGEVEASPVFDAAGRIAWSGDGIRAFGGGPAAARVALSGVAVAQMHRVGALGAEDGVFSGPPGGLQVCDDLPEADGWSCLTEATGVERCERVGPLVFDGWRCAYDAGQLRCERDLTEEPSSDAGAIPQPPASSAGLPEACREALRELLVSPAMAPFVHSPGTLRRAIHGIIGEEGTAGFMEGAWQPGLTRRPLDAAWSCSETGGFRRCDLGGVGASARLPLDTPSGWGAPGWLCEAPAGAPVCARASVARYAMERAELPEDLVSLDAASPLGQRSALAPAGLRFSFSAQPTSPPGLPAPARLVTGDLLTETGNLVGGLVAGPRGIEPAP